MAEASAFRAGCTSRSRMAISELAPANGVSSGIAAEATPQATVSHTVRRHSQHGQRVCNNTMAAAVFVQARRL